MCHNLLRTWFCLRQFLQGLSVDVISSPEDEVASNVNKNDRDHEFAEDNPENEAEYNQMLKMKMKKEIKNKIINF